MDAETLRQRTRDVLALCFAELRDDEVEVIRALYDRAFPEVGGPPTVEEVKRGLTRWVVRLNSDEDDTVFATAIVDGARIELVARGWWMWNDSPGWQALRCRPVGADAQPVRREP